MKKVIYFQIFFLLIFIMKNFSIETPFFYKGARPIGFGDAFTAVADDENTVSYNPAGLSDIRENKIAIAGKIFTYDFLNKNYTNNYASFTLIYARSFGIQIFYNVLGDRILLSQDRILLYEGLKIIAAFAHNVNEALSIGLNGNIIVQTGKAGGAEFDIGIMYKINKYLKAGMTIRNFISSGNFLILDDSANVRIISYPVFFNIGISAKPFTFLLTSFEIKNIFETQSFFVDLEIDENKYITFKKSYHLGCEINFLENFFIMNGLEAKEDIFNLEFLDIYKMRYKISFGLGCKFKFVRSNIVLANDFREISNAKNPWQIYFSVVGDY